MVPVTARGRDLSCPADLSCARPLVAWRTGIGDNIWIGCPVHGGIRLVERVEVLDVRVTVPA